jgi:cell fate (sporulation/competence/biofilm development) regulator YlbF (YheA/YmcA/DUF963 family)
MHRPDYISSSTGYTEGYRAGKQYTLLELQSRLSEVALNSKANDYEARYENLVIMLSEVDQIINKMLEDL